MTETAITRRAAIRSGTLGALAASVAGLLPSTPAPALAAPELPLIDRAEALVLQLEALLLAMTERDRNNLGQLLDMMGQAAGRRDDLVAEGLEDMHAYIGPGNRVHDQMDAEEAAQRQAAVTHPAVVARFADVIDAGDGAAGQYGVTTTVRQDAQAEYGDKLGLAIADAAFDLHLHRLYHGGGDAVSCERCNEDV